MLDDLISSSNKSLETSIYVLLESLAISLSSFTGCLGHISFSIWQLSKSALVCVCEHGGGLDVCVLECDAWRALGAGTQIVNPIP